MNFKKVIEGCEIFDLHTGLKALVNHGKKLKIKVKISGSIHIDKDLEKQHPNHPRWDYLVGVDDSKTISLFIEVHPAHTSEVKVVINKFSWLKRVVAEICPELLKDVHYIWIFTDKDNVLRNSSQYRLLTQSGIKGPFKHYTYKKAS